MVDLLSRFNQIVPELPLVTRMLGLGLPVRSSGAGGTWHLTPCAECSLLMKGGTNDRQMRDISAWCRVYASRRWRSYDLVQHPPPVSGTVRRMVLVAAARYAQPRDVGCPRFAPPLIPGTSSVVRVNPIPERCVPCLRNGPALGDPASRHLYAHGSHQIVCLPNGESEPEVWESDGTLMDGISVCIGCGALHARERNCHDHDPCTPVAPCGSNAPDCRRTDRAGSVRTDDHRGVGDICQRWPGAANNPGCQTLSRDPSFVRGVLPFAVGHKLQTGISAHCCCWYCRDHCTARVAATDK